MGMNMKNGLPGIEVGVEDNPIPRLKNPLKLSNLTSTERNGSKQLRISSRQRSKVPIPNLGHHKHMNLRLRPNIPKGKGAVVLVDDISRDLPSNDPLEESLILTHEKHPTDQAAPQDLHGAQARGVRGGNPRLGVWGFDPQKTQRTQAAH